MTDEEFSQYYHHFVRTSYTNFRDMLGVRNTGTMDDLRRAKEASLSLYHLREHLPQRATIKDKDIESLCREYGVLRDVSNAFKHNTLSNPKHTYVKSVDQISELMLSIEYKDAHGKYWHNQKTIEIITVANVSIALIDVLTKVINFWERYLASVELISSEIVFQHDHGIRFRSREEAHTDLDISVVRGLALSMQFRFMRYNNDLGEARLIDLSEPQARVSLHQPNICRVEIYEDISEIFVSEDYCMTEDEVVQFNKLTDTERDAFISVHDGIHQVARELVSKFEEIRKKQGGRSIASGDVSVRDQT